MIKPGLKPRGSGAQPGAKASLLSDSFSPLSERSSPFNTLPQGLCLSRTSTDYENASRNPFKPELVTAHCFKQFKKKDFHLPQSRRRIIILPQKEDPTPVNPMPQPQALLQPTCSFKALEARDIQKTPEDTRTWLSRRMKFRQELESFGNIDRWLRNKSRFTPSEAKILHMPPKEHETQAMAHLPIAGATNVSIPIC